jgi:hypothetical protein
VPLWAPFQYREFYDVPRQVVVQHGDRTFLLDCRFDETRDDYSDEYEVFEFPTLAPELLRGSKDLRGLAMNLLGPVKVRDVRFDPTRRREVDLTSIPPIATAG